MYVIPRHKAKENPNAFRKKRKLAFFAFFLLKCEFKNLQMTRASSSVNEYRILENMPNNTEKTADDKSIEKGIGIN